MENYTEKEIRTTNLLPIVPLRGKVAFPHTNVSFEVGRDMTLKAIDRASATDRTVLILTQRETEKDNITPADVYTVGCVARIKQVAQLTGGVIRVLCEGLYRAKARG
ncbi:MAG: LON peptidase substrate-binding domain-containing protein, partial [Clostridia bacterium]|nr:LON peptidase substrate-binding domain-containing protein [Clostridia bacterium]